jgi:hypothetical protein
MLPALVEGAVTVRKARRHPELVPVIGAQHRIGMASECRRSAPDVDGGVDPDQGKVACIPYLREETSRVADAPRRHNLNFRQCRVENLHVMLRTTTFPLRQGAAAAATGAEDQNRSVEYPSPIGHNRL